MRQIKLLTLFVATMFATNMWATPVSLGDGTGLAWEIVGTTLTITNTVQGGTCAIPDYNVDGSGEKSYPGWYSQAANITAISLPEYLTRIGNHAFAGMTNEALTSLTIPATVTSIGDQAIRISHLETLTCLPTTAPTQGYAFITDHAEPFTIIYPCGSGYNYTHAWVEFYHYLTPATPCDEAKPDFTEGGLIKYSSYYNFRASTGVLTIYGSGGTGEFMNADQQVWSRYRNLITSVSVESGITYTSPYSFDGLTELTSVTLPTSLIAISSYAFANCTKLPSITLPSSVQYIDDYAFRNCTGLRSITSLATTPPAPNDPNSLLAFDGVSKSIPVYVPAASVDAYKAADLWKDFANILAIPEPVSLGDGSNLQYQLYAIHAGQPQKALVITLIDENNNGTMPDYNVDEDGDKSYPGWYSERANIASISLPEGLTNIGNHAFAGMTNAALTELTIPSTVTIIGDRSIRISHLQTLTCLRAYPNPLPIDYFVTSLGNSVITEHAENLSIIYPCGNGFNYVHSWVEYFHYLTPAAPCNEPKPDFVQGGKLYYKNDPEYAFSGYSGVLTISGTGAAAFYYESLNNQLWSWYRNLITSLVVEDGITGIGGYLCYGLTELTSVTLPASSVMYIGSYAFANCSKLPSITIPASVQGVNDYAFQNCTGLQSITCLATTPPAAMSDAFAGVNKSIPVYVPAAGLDAYKAADQWKDFTNILAIPEPVSLGDGTGLSWVIDGTTLTIMYDGVGTGIMPDYMLITPKAPWYADHRWDITSIVLPEGMTHIGSYAFLNLSGVTTTVTLPSTLTSIGAYAFSGCNITSIAIPAGMTAVDDNAFNMCSKLASVTIPSSVTSIGANAFAGTKIASFSLPAGLTLIDEGAFANNSALSSITIPANVTEIGLSAFSYCTNLTSVTCLPTTAPTLGNNAFCNHHEDLVITYPNGSDQDYANKFLQYYDCLRNASSSAQAPLPHLTGTSGSLTWDLSFTGSGTLMEHDGTLALSGTGAMADYDWTNNVWAPWLNYAEFINHINIASGVTKIGESSFANMTHVNTFIIPASVTYIGGDAFMGCNNPEAIVYCYANPATLEWHDNVSEYEGEGWPPDDFLLLTRNAWGNYTWHVQATKCVVPSNYLAGYKAKWARGGDYKWWDLNVCFTSELQDGESAEYINNALNDLNGQTAPVVSLVRPLNRDGYFATICLPFPMSAAQIAESSLHGAEIKEFTDATVSGGTLDIVFSPVDHIEAGKPYFVKFENEELLGDALDRLDFMEVVINNAAPQPVTHGGLTMTGTFVPKHVAAQTNATNGDGVLFLGPNNTLYWPNAAGNIKPFRAYFSIASGSGAPIRHGMPARIVERENVATAIDNTASETRCVKTIENGMLIIEMNGVRYNAQGQIVK